MKMETKFLSINDTFTHVVSHDPYRLYSWKVHTNMYYECETHDNKIQYTFYACHPGSYYIKFVYSREYTSYIAHIHKFFIKVNNDDYIPPWKLIKKKSNIPPYSPILDTR